MPFFITNLKSPAFVFSLISLVSTLLMSAAMVGAVFADDIAKNHTLFAILTCVFGLLTLVLLGISLRHYREAKAKATVTDEDDTDRVQLTKGGQPV